jgi:putative membrane protein
MKLLLTWVLHATALMALAHLYNGVEVTSFGSAMMAALVIGIFNLIVRPALVVLTLPVTFFTLGLFLFVINAFMFWATAGLLDGFWVRGFGSALLGSLLYSAFGVVIDSALERLFPPQIL